MYNCHRRRMMDAVLALPIAQELLSRHDFKPTAQMVKPVIFDDDINRDEYRFARQWCSENCTGKWRPEPDRLRNRATFQFELERDAVLFRLRFDDLL